MNFLTFLCNNAVSAANLTPVVTQMKNENDVVIAGIVCIAIVFVSSFFCICIQFLFRRVFMLAL